VPEAQLARPKGAAALAPPFALMMVALFWPQPSPQESFIVKAMALHAPPEEAAGAALVGMLVGALVGVLVGAGVAGAGAGPDDADALPTVVAAVQAPLAGHDLDTPLNVHEISDL